MWFRTAVSAGAQQRCTDAHAARRFLLVASGMLLLGSDGRVRHQQHQNHQPHAGGAPTPGHVLTSQWHAPAPAPAPST